MQTLIKSIISVVIILGVTAIGKRFSTLAGIISVMPLTGALALFWIYVENKGDQAVMNGFLKGAIFGIIPTIIFFIVALYFFKRGASLSTMFLTGFAAWFAVALLHQVILK